MASQSSNQLINEYFEFMGFTVNKNVSSDAQENIYLNNYCNNILYSKLIDNINKNMFISDDPNFRDGSSIDVNFISWFNSLILERKTIYVLPTKKQCMLMFDTLEKMYHYCDEPLSVGIILSDEQINNGADIIVTTPEIFLNNCYQEVNFSEQEKFGFDIDSEECVIIFHNLNKMLTSDRLCIIKQCLYYCYTIHHYNFVTHCIYSSINITNMVAHDYINKYILSIVMEETEIDYIHFVYMNNNLLNSNSNVNVYQFYNIPDSYASRKDASINRAIIPRISNKLMKITDTDYQRTTNNIKKVQNDVKANEYVVKWIFALKSCLVNIRDNYREVMFPCVVYSFSIKMIRNLVNNINIGLYSRNDNGDEQELHKRHTNTINSFIYGEVKSKYSDEEFTAYTSTAEYKNLNFLLKKGIAYYYSSMSDFNKYIIEQLYMMGCIRVVISTDSGRDIFNPYSKAVILTSAYKNECRNSDTSAGLKQFIYPEIISENIGMKLYNSNGTDKNLILMYNFMDAKQMNIYTEAVNQIQNDFTNGDADMTEYISSYDIGQSTMLKHKMGPSVYSHYTSLVDDTYESINEESGIIELENVMLNTFVSKSSYGKSLYNLIYCNLTDGSDITIDMFINMYINEYPHITRSLKMNEQDILSMVHLDIMKWIEVVDKKEPFTYSDFVNVFNKVSNPYSTIFSFNKICSQVLKYMKEFMVVLDSISETTEIDVVHTKSILTNLVSNIIKYDIN